MYGPPLPRERKESEEARRHWNRNAVPDEQVNRPSALFDLSIVSNSPPDLGAARLVFG